MKPVDYYNMDEIWWQQQIESLSCFFSKYLCGVLPSHSHSSPIKFVFKPEDDDKPISIISRSAPTEPIHKHAFLCIHIYSTYISYL